MKIHSTNYYHTFIAVADDCPASKGEIPAEKGGQKTVAGQQLEMIVKNPYRYTSHEVLFSLFAQRNDLTYEELEEARVKFFSKGQACLRASALGKRYGWGIHHNAEGKIAVYGCNTSEYRDYLNQKELRIVKAIRSKK